MSSPRSELFTPLVEDRKRIRGVCDQAVPLFVTDVGHVHRHEPITDIGNFMKASACARSISNMENKERSVGRGVWGEVRELTTFPSIVSKRIAFPSPNGSIQTSSRSRDFEEALRGTNETEQRKILSWLSKDDPILREAHIHARLSWLMQDGDIPPCVPLFVGSYVGLTDVPELQSGWKSMGNDGTVRILTRNLPGLYILMENLRPRLVDTMWKHAFIKGSTGYERMYACLFTCLSILYHRYSFVHGDLHPNNVLLCRTPMQHLCIRLFAAEQSPPTFIAAYRIQTDGMFPVIIDFGMSRMGKGERREVANTDTVKHQSGGFYTYDVPKDNELGGLLSDIARFLDKESTDSPFMLSLLDYSPIHRKLAEAGRLSPERHLWGRRLAHAKVPNVMVLHAVLDAWAKKLPSADVDMDSDTWTYDLNVRKWDDLLPNAPVATPDINLINLWETEK